MQVSRPIVLFVPSCFKVELDIALQEFKPKFLFREEIAFYLIRHIVVVSTIQNKKEYVGLNIAKLKGIVGNNVRRYLKYLADNKLIAREKIRNKNGGWASYNYKLNDNAMNGELEKFLIIESMPIYHRILKQQRRSKAHRFRLAPHLKTMVDHFKKLEIDYQKALNWAYENSETPTKLFLYLTTIEVFQEKRFRNFKRNKTNFRLDTNITSLKKELRAFIIGDYTLIDLKNS